MIAEPTITRQMWFDALKIARRYTKATFRQLDIDEVVSKTMLALVSSADTYNGTGKWAQWVIQQVRWTASSEWRWRKNRATRMKAIIVSKASKAMAHESGLHRIVKSEDIKHAQAVFDALPEPRRTISDLRIRGLAYDEIATAIGCPLGTVCSSLRRAELDFMFAMEDAA